MTGQLNWFKGGIALGLTFLLAVLLVKPIGVSTQFVILDGMIWNTFAKELIKEDSTAKSGYSSSNAYLNKSGGKYAKNIKKPANYSLIFVLSMILGGLLSRVLAGPKPSTQDKVAPAAWRQRFGDSGGKRYAFAFIGGVLALLGARLAGGCTSGHMMSGMMQTAVSGYLFALGTFTAAIPMAILLYGRDGEV
ncbi:MAG: YeeE/YedE family protein [Proteobacteria bacterium]|nr:YeeE/YedE family protein [Pseudomonadota bacterium]MBU1639065.1 YeeE/YedE family protein [Pseudomonadota bacterium]